jgi:hypothetical protein
MFDHSGQQIVILTTTWWWQKINKDHRFHMERFNLKELNEVGGKEQFGVEVSNNLQLEDLGTEVEINSAWETIRENITISAKESLGYFDLKKNKPWFGEG